MRKVFVVLSVLCVLGLVAAVADECDLKTIEKGLNCSKCDKIVEKDAVKDGKCAKCETAVTEIEVCVKTVKGADGEETVDKARVLCACTDCAEKCCVGGKQKAGCECKTCKKTCEKAGKAPHVK